MLKILGLFAEGIKEMKEKWVGRSRKLMKLHLKLHSKTDFIIMCKFAYSVACDRGDYYPWMRGRVRL